MNKGGEVLSYASCVFLFCLRAMHVKLELGSVNYMFLCPAFGVPIYKFHNAKIRGMCSNLFGFNCV